MAARGKLSIIFGEGLHAWHENINTGILHEIRNMISITIDFTLAIRHLGMYDDDVTHGHKNELIQKKLITRKAFQTSSI